MKNDDKYIALLEKNNKELETLNEAYTKNMSRLETKILGLENKVEKQEKLIQKYQELISNFKDEFDNIKA